MKTVGCVGVYVSWSIMQPPSGLIIPPVPMETSPPPPPEPVMTTRPPVPLPPVAPEPPWPLPLPPLPVTLILTPAWQPKAATAASASAPAVRKDAAPRRG